MDIIFLLLYFLNSFILRFIFNLIDEKIDNIFLYISLSIISMVAFIITFTYQSYYLVIKNETYIYLVIIVMGIGIYNINKTREEKQ